MSPSRLPNYAVCIYSHSSVETTKSASVRMQFGYVIPIPANSCQCAKSVEPRYTLVMHGVCEMSSSLHTITLSTRLSPTGHRGQLINLTCRVFHGNCEECISAFKLPALIEAGLSLHWRHLPTVYHHWANHNKRQLSASASGSHITMITHDVETT